MKILTILGTRPEIIRLSRVIPLLDKHTEQTIVHTGQNYDYELDKVFFETLGLRAPDHYLGAKGSYGEQIGAIGKGLEQIFAKHKFDRFLVLGDTNSSLGAIFAKRAMVPVYHMEAGNRSFDDRTPEEVNRRIIDHISDVLLPYTENSRRYLIQEGIHPGRIYVTGNPIYEVLNYYRPQIDASSILPDLGLEIGKYFLVTMHRAENVDILERLSTFCDVFQALSRLYNVPVVVSTHPRLKSRLESIGNNIGKSNTATGDVRFLKPFNFFQFINLQLNSLATLTDSGTVQEECAILGVKNLTIRDATERPETLECGTNIITGCDEKRILKMMEMVISCDSQKRAPTEYLESNVSESTVNILLSHRRFKHLL